jgi:hypothetical protein
MGKSNINYEELEAQLKALLSTKSSFSSNIGKHIKSYQELESKFRDLFSTKYTITPEPEKNIFEISRYAHYENVISNWYAFFLDSSNEHGLGRLFLDSLLEIIKDNSDNLNFDMYKCNVVREVCTDSGRFDILLYEGEDESKPKSAILIENKIYAKVYNPLDEYFSFVNSDNKIGVLLSLKKENKVHKNFINITHELLIDRIKLKLNEYWDNINIKYLIIMKDLFSYLVSLTKGIKMTDEIKFYIDKSEDIERLLELRKKANLYIFKNIEHFTSSSDYWNLKLTVNETKVAISSEEDNFWGVMSYPELFNKRLLFIEFNLHKEYVNKWKNVHNYDVLRAKYKDFDWQLTKSSKGWINLVRKTYSNISIEQIDNFEKTLNDIFAEWHSLLNELKEIIDKAN